MITTSSVALQKANAYLNRLVIAGATLTTAQRAAITALAKAIDGIGVSKFSAFYPFLGATAACHALDMLGTYDITWAGTLTHDANGVTGDGSTGWGDTNFPFASLPSTWAMSAYCNNDGNGIAPLIGWMGYTESYNRCVYAIASVPVYGVYSGRYDVAAANDRVEASAAGDGFITGVRYSNTDLRLYRNGAQVGATYTTAQSLTDPPNSARLLRRSNSADSNASRIASAHIGSDLTSGEVATLNTAVQAYQTALARNV